MRAVLAGVIITYRLIPARVRSLWSLGTSSSHLALGAVRTSAAPLRTFLRYATVVRDRSGQPAWFLGD